MRTSTELVDINHEYEEYIHQRMKETNVHVLFDIRLTDMGEYTQTLNYFQNLLIQMSLEHEDRPNIDYSMSRAHRLNREYSIALKFLHHAEYLQRIKLLESKFDLARTFAGIGSVYYE